MIVGLLVGGCGSGYDHSFTWQVEETHRWTELPSPRGAGAGFDRIDSARTGVDFVNTLAEDLVAENQHLMNGSGVAIGDVNGDDWPDLFLTRIDGPNAVYLNEGSGAFRFQKVPGAGGAALPHVFSTGAVLVDVTGDERRDVIVTSLGGPNVLFANEGGGTFRRVDGAGLRAGRGSTTMALADLNGDEALDLYVANYKRKAMRDSLPPDQLGFDDVVQQLGPEEYRIAPKFEDEYELRIEGDKIFHLERGEADRVYFNDGTGQFREQAWDDVFRGAKGEGRETPRDWGLVARLEDLNGDGVPDLYVCNDFESPDFYYLGDEDQGRFREAPEEVLRTTSHSTMSIATTDLERNGAVDFFLADMLGQSYERRQEQVSTRAPIPRGVGDETARMQEMQNTLQLDRGDGTYTEVAQWAGVEASGWTWSSAFLDVNLDGYSDLLLSTGHAFDVQNADAQTQMNVLKQQARTFDDFRRIILNYPPLDLPNVAYRNEGDGTFTEMEEGWGLGVEPDVGHGMARGDLDGDGDLDVVINRLNRPVGIYRNEGTGARVAVRLAGRAPNTGAIGARVRVEPEGGDVPAQEKALIAGGEYLSDSGETLSFAMGEAEEAEIRVTWPTGEETIVSGRAGRMYEVRQPGAEPPWSSPRSERLQASH